MLKRRIFFPLLAILAFVGCWWLFNQPNQPLAPATGQAVQGRLKISFLAVGQGDAILIQSPDGKKALIDGGESSEKLLIALTNELGWFDKTIDLLILTHPHSDHVKGLNGLFERWQIGEAFGALVNHNSSAYQFWLDNLRSRNIKLTPLAWPQELTLGSEIKLTVLSPSESLVGQDVSNLNNSSLVILLTYGQTKFLLMGDAEEEVEKGLLSRGFDLSAQVLKVGHHGSSTATNQEFLSAVYPQIAVISVGLNNDFGHPHERVLNRLARDGIKIFRTDQSGTVNFISDGQNIELLK